MRFFRQVRTQATHTPRCGPKYPVQDSLIEVVLIRFQVNSLYRLVIRIWIDSPAGSESKMAEPVDRAVALQKWFSHLVFLTNKFSVRLGVFFAFQHETWTTRIGFTRNRTRYIYIGAVLSLQFVRLSTKRSEHQEEALGRRDDDHQTENQQWCVMFFTL